MIAQRAMRIPFFYFNIKIRNRSSVSSTEDLFGVLRTNFVVSKSKAANPIKQVLFSDFNDIAVSYVWIFTRSF